VAAVEAEEAAAAGAGAAAAGSAKRGRRKAQSTAEDNALVLTDYVSGEAAEARGVPIRCDTGTFAGIKV
jgi:hypothetical protein